MSVHPEIITPDLSSLIHKTPRFPVRRHFSPDVWRNGVAVRMPNHLGDAMMALPALAQLKKLIPPDCGLFVIAPESQRLIYVALPIVDGMVGLERLHRLWSPGEMLAVRQLRAGIGILFSNSLRDTFTMRLAGIRQLFGAAARGRSPFLKRAFSFPPHQRRGHLAGEHLASRYSAIVEALGAPVWDGKLPEFKPKSSADEMYSYLTELCCHPRLLLLAAGAAYGAAKRWPAEYFNLVARHWVKTGGIAVALGNKLEREIGDEVLAGIEERKCTNLCGKTRFDELIQLLRHARMVVSNDSGLMHLGAVMGARGVAIFGPTDPTATAPLSEKWRLVFSHWECAPCFERVCPRNNPECMRTISPRTVLRAMRELDKK